MSSQDSQPFHWHFSADLNDNDFVIHGQTLFLIIIILFSLLVLITTLFLYARCVCRYRQQHFPNNPPLHAPPLRSQGLHPTIIKSLPVTLHQSSSSSLCGGNRGNSNVVVEAECCICLGVFEDGDKVKVLPECHHSFHSECVDRWLSARSNCPLCRASLLQGHPAGSPVLSILTE
ncbi:hypothetical protein P3X46_025766 [Hevea brasiliensis]|uniref:RING-type domain-containing protein n=1 Tax=Hevea brasiliensis TaxID=3981 RepID=A0ABQ9L7N1_HEVBR|nr:RING-H2 finger protein ATL66 [Hevea brasiliensis]KAJ9160358.1 hypothetical protein P3X46_025766 [Hevea brasiliensis]